MSKMNSYLIVLVFIKHLSKIILNFNIIYEIFILFQSLVYILHKINESRI